MVAALYKYLGSCGCIWREVITATKKTHGMTGTRIYRLWSMMLDRCRNPNSDYYSNYGGRGIAVCDRWQSFENFYKDMGDRPAGKTLERVDNDGPYAPWNCEWASCQVQARNKRKQSVLEGIGGHAC